MKWGPDFFFFLISCCSFWVEEIQPCLVLTVALKILSVIRKRESILLQRELVGRTITCNLITQQTSLIVMESLGHG